MAVNKVEYNDNGQLKTLIDLTADTVTADKLAKGYTHMICQEISLQVLWKVEIL